MPLLGGHLMPGHQSQATSLKLVVCHNTVWLTVVLSVHTCVLVVERSSKAIPDTVVERSLLRRFPRNTPAWNLIVSFPGLPARLLHRRCGLHIFCWNSGGLGGGLYPELLTYLTASATDVAIILETKWQENMEFTTGPWTCIHGGCKSRKEAGILILVRQSLVPASRYDVNTCCKAGWLMCASRSEAPKPDTCMS